MAGKLRISAYAIVVSPFVGALVAALPLGTWWALSNANYQERAATAFELVFATAVAWIMGNLVAVPSTLVLGIAWRIFAARTGLAGAVWYAAPGAIAGALIGGILSLVTSPPFWLVALIWGSVAGGVTGWTAWLIRRPDRDAPPTQASPTP